MNIIDTPQHPFSGASAEFRSAFTTHIDGVDIYYFPLDTGTKAYLVGRTEREWITDSELNAVLAHGIDAGWPPTVEHAWPASVRGYLVAHFTLLR